MALAALSPPVAQPAEPLRVLDVPFLAQSEALCGGAAAAMVLRYWGEDSAQPQWFAPLVDLERQGITTGALVAELRRRGNEARPFRADPASVRHHLERGRPVIALLEVAPGRYHYVVLVAWRGDRVLLHDPAQGPFEVRSVADLMASWASAEHWALLLLPGPATPDPPPPPAPPSPDAGPCAALVDNAVALARAGDGAAAGLRLGAAAQLCPFDGRVHRERAALHFRAERWNEAAAAATHATHLDPTDGHAWRLLATSLYLAGRPARALRAWNRVGEPAIDSVSFEGLRRSRHDALLAYCALPAEGTLRPGALVRATRRLEELPAAASAAIRYTPLGGGRARVVAAVPERPLLSPWRTLLPGLAADAITERETRLRLHGLARRGDGLEAGGRWWSRRPAAWLRAGAPHALGLPGVVTASLSWEEQAYAPDSGGGTERRRRAGLTVADWASSRLRWEVGLAGERWTDAGDGVSLAGGLRLHLAEDRLAFQVRAEARPALGEGPGFGAWRAGLAVRSSSQSRRLEARARASFEAASERAPRGLWPGAGTGHARATLLRSHPLLEDGVVSGPAFGTRLLAASAELELRLARLGPIRLGLAAFVDHARARRPREPWDAGLSGAGAGLRLHLPGDRALRIDLATPLDAPGATLSAGWINRWPG